MPTFLAVDPCDYEIRSLYRFATLKPETGLLEALRPMWPTNPRLLNELADDAVVIGLDEVALAAAGLLAEEGHRFG